MTKRGLSGPKNSTAQPTPSRRADAGRAPGKSSGTQHKGGAFLSSAAVRETVESVVIAFVLAFMFRTFEAEAFVIPTGSMAPTLMGRHKDLTCPECGFAFQASASEEVNEDGSPKLPAEMYMVRRCTCPMCRRTFDVDTGRREHRSFKGDRIIVAKFPYQFGEPQRWDVAVFRYPGEAYKNYIKRIVGLPHETVKIHYGDVYVRDDRQGDGQFRIQRKPPNKLLAMLQPVFDNDLMPAIIRSGFPTPRWQPEPLVPDTPNWQPEDDYRAYRVEARPETEVWLRYRHLLPTQAQWAKVAARGGQRRLPPGEQLRPLLITDFSAYNTSQSRESPQEPDLIGLHPVGDLALECQLEVLSDSGQAVLELVKGGRRFQCRFDLRTGAATMCIDGRGLVASGGQQYRFHPTAKTRVRGPGKYHLRFSNCDEQLLLWVDGKLVRFDADTCYPPLRNQQPQVEDLAPAGIAALGAALRVSHIKLWRDVYYIAESSKQPLSNYPKSEFGRPDIIGPDKPEYWRDFLADPRQWSVFQRRRAVEFTLKADEFLALGDNSIKSKDSRLWGDVEVDGKLVPSCVHRDLLIGKALLIYWPHSWDWPVPLFPNFARMGFVR